MKTAELKSKIITQLRFHRISGKHENLTADHLIEIMEEYRSNLWTSPCDCNPEEKTGETWCCNLCGRPTARMTSKELPGDEEMKDWAEIHAIHCYHDGLTSKKHFVEGYLYAVDFYKNNYASPLLASKDARIRELEDTVKYWVEAWNRLSKMFSDQNEILTTLTPPKN